MNLTHIIVLLVLLLFPIKQAFGFPGQVQSWFGEQVGFTALDRVGCCRVDGFRNGVDSLADEYGNLYIAETNFVDVNDLTSAELYLRRVSPGGWVNGIAWPDFRSRGRASAIAYTSLPLPRVGSSRNQTMVSLIQYEYASESAWVADRRNFQRLLVAATANASLIIFCFKMNGELDLSFGPAGTGMVQVPLPGHAIRKLSIAGNEDNLYVATSIESIDESRNVNSAMLLAKFSNRGMPETNFGINGQKSIRLRTDENTRNRLDKIVRNPAGGFYLMGRLIIYGSEPDDFDQKALLGKLDSQGEFDLSFSRRLGGHFPETGFRVVADMPSQLEWPNDLTIQRDGKLLMAGQIDRDDADSLLDGAGPQQGLAAIWRLYPNGNLDYGFGDLGFVKFSPASYIYADYPSLFNEVEIDEEDNILLAGSFLGMGYFARLSENGERDTLFGWDQNYLKPKDAGTVVVESVYSCKRLHLTNFGFRCVGVGVDNRSLPFNEATPQIRVVGLERY